ncbi:uncharacterized protein LOC117218187 [Megalopta genalis]|uniref:uncharacterized protein LOC117218187 n=1 Tax=Megalopta genalis TaxID=115081 RepID=UPI003FD09FAC
MGAMIELFLLSVLCASVGTVQGACKHVPNDDMVEYSCEGGRMSDLDDLPASTGKIRISNMPIPMITRDTFSRFGSDLWVLGCSHCGIRDIEPGAFHHLQNLQQLSLDNNHLSTLRDSWFRGLDYLTYLDLNYNAIGSIEDGVFQTLPSLVDLRLSGNRLECLNLEAVSKLKELKRMFLTENSQFKCPNAVSAYFEKNGVSFERDPEWNRIAEDLIPAGLPYDDHRDSTTARYTPLPAYRERLHPPSPTPSPEPSTPSYLSQRVRTTEEVIYRPSFQPPDWRATTPSVPATDDYEYYDEEDSEETRPPYVPPQTIAPVESVTIQQQSGVDETTLRTWPRIPEYSNGLYPPHANEDGDYRQPSYSTEAGPLPLATVQDQMPPFAESDVGQTPRLTANDWQRQPDRHRPPAEVLPRMPDTEDWQQQPDRHRPPEVLPRMPDTEDWQQQPDRHRPPEVLPRMPDTEDWQQQPDRHRPLEVLPRMPDTEDWQQQPDRHRPPAEVLPRMPDTDDANRVVAPPEPEMPTLVQPATSDNVYQAPYYEQAVTVHSSGPVIAAEGQTTTDKPLPECPMPNSSATGRRSLEVVVLSVLVVLAGRAFVEGF